MARAALYLTVAAVAAALCGVPWLATEDWFDARLQTLRDLASEEEPIAVIVDLRAAGRWPLERGAIARMASAAIDGGARAVGIEVDMSHATSTSDDTALAELVKREPRIVPLALMGVTSDSVDSLGFVYNENASLAGVRCASEPAPFALRVARSAGASTSDIGSGCSTGLLRPYLQVRNGVPILDVVLLEQETTTAVRGKVVLFGTLDPLTSVRTYSGTHAATYVNAAIVNGAIRKQWRTSGLTFSIAVCLVVVLGMWLVAGSHASTARLIVASVVLLSILIAARLWVWFPLIPASLSLALLSGIEAIRPAWMQR